MSRKVSPFEFEIMRAQRREAVAAIVAETAERWGCDPSEISTTFDDRACICACPEGPCEHKWGQELHPVIDQDGHHCGDQVVCSRCGMGAMDHDMRCGE